jgi:uncharacterized protein (TIGR00369 family)
LNKQPNSDMCFVCGENNPAGIHVRFYDTDDGTVLSRFTGAAHHQGYPDRMHGGIISAVMDEAMGRVIRLSHGDDVWGVTVELTIRFRKPVPLGVELTAIGRLVGEKSRTFEASGELLLPSGEVAVEGIGKYVKLSVAQLGDFEPTRDGWGVRPD